MAGGANPQMAQPAMNPYTAAAGAQGAAMGRVGQGLTQTAAGGMGAYQNPYETQVVQQSLRDVGTQAQMGLNQLDAQAQQARAFGGSRHGIATGEALKGYNQQMADTAARMRQQGFQTALGASQADLNRQLGAAGQLAGMGQQSFGYGQAIQQQQMQQGQQQRQMMQELINAGKQQYAGYTGAPQQGLATFLGAMSGVPNLQGQQQGYNAGFLDYLMAAGQFA